MYFCIHFGLWQFQSLIYLCWSPKRSLSVSVWIWVYIIKIPLSSLISSLWFVCLSRIVSQYMSLSFNPFLSLWHHFFLIVRVFFLSCLRSVTSSLVFQSLFGPVISSTPFTYVLLPSAVSTHQSPSSVFKLLVSFILCQILIVTASRSVPSSNFIRSGYSCLFLVLSVFWFSFFEYFWLCRVFLCKE